VLACVDDCFLLGWEHRFCKLFLLHKFLVKVGKVLLDLWFVGRFDFTFEEFRNVDRFKPGMAQDLFDAVDSETRLFVFIQKAQDQVLSIIRHGDLVAFRVREVDL
jgi:hypothetical protein